MTKRSDTLKVDEDSLCILCLIFRVSRNWITFPVVSESVSFFSKTLLFVSRFW